MSAYKILKPSSSPPVRRSHADLYAALEALRPDEWLPVRCNSRLAARNLGIAVQARYRKARSAGETRRCETRMSQNGDPVIHLRLVDRALSTATRGRRNDEAQGALRDH